VAASQNTATAPSLSKTLIWRCYNWLQIRMSIWALTFVLQWFGFLGYFFFPSCSISFKTSLLLNECSKQCRKNSNYSSAALRTENKCLTAKWNIRGDVKNRMQIQEEEFGLDVHSGTSYKILFGILNSPEQSWPQTLFYSKIVITVLEKLQSHSWGVQCLQLGWNRIIPSLSHQSLPSPESI